MAEIETKITIKLNKPEFKALQTLLSKQYHNDVAGLLANEKDLVNGVFFKMNDAEMNDR